MEKEKESILGTLEDGYYEIDFRGNLTDFNPSLAKIFGRAPETLLGLNHREYTHPDYLDKVFQAFSEVHRTGIPKSRFYYQIFRPDGSLRSAQYSVHLARDEHGEPAGYRGIVRDVTVEERHRRTNETLRSVSELVSGTLELHEVLKRCCDAVVEQSVADRASIYLYDREAGTFSAVMSRGAQDPALWEKFSKQPALTPGNTPAFAHVLQSWEALIVEDTSTNAELSREAIELYNLKSLVIYPLVVRGEFVGVLAVDAFRQAVHFPAPEIDLMQQISRQLASAIYQAQLYDAVREEAARFRLITTAMRDLVTVFTHKGEVEYASPSFVASTGYEQKALRDMRLIERVNAADRQRVQKWFEAHLAGAASDPDRGALEFRLRCADGREHWVETTASPVCADDGSVTKLVTSGRLIDERKRLEAEMETLAFYDPVTGLPNRSLLLDRLEHALERLPRSHNRVGVCFIDLDRFKEINDGRGHSAGDRVLRAVSARLGSCARATDTLARFGGDEFVLLLEEVSDSKAARQIVSRLESALSTPLQIDNQRVPVSASIGLTFSRPGHMNTDALLSEADNAMYEAKKAGGARAVEWGCGGFRTLQGKRFLRPER